MSGASKACQQSWCMLICPQATRQHTSAYVSIRQHTSAYVTAFVSIRQHMSASRDSKDSEYRRSALPESLCVCFAPVSVRLHAIPLAKACHSSSSAMLKKDGNSGLLCFYFGRKTPVLLFWASSRTSCSSMRRSFSSSNDSITFFLVGGVICNSSC